MLFCGKNCGIPHQLLRYEKCLSTRIRIIYFRKVPIGAQLANRSAALLREVNNDLLSAEGYSEPTQTSEMKLFTAIVDGIKP